jgi:hypothetical protein
MIVKSSTNIYKSICRARIVEETVRSVCKLIDLLMSFEKVAKKVARLMSLMMYIRIDG